MSATCWYGNNVANIYLLLCIINIYHTLTRHDDPNLITSAMAMIAHTLSSIHYNFDSDTIFIGINNSEIAPGFFSKHNLLINLIYIRLNLTGLLFVRNQNTFRAHGHDDIT